MIAVARNPEVMVAQRPLHHYDAKTAVQMTKLLRVTWRRGLEFRVWGARGPRAARASLDALKFALSLNPYAA